MLIYAAAFAIVESGRLYRWISQNGIGMKKPMIMAKGISQYGFPTVNLGRRLFATIRRTTQIHLQFFAKGTHCHGGRIVLLNDPTAPLHWHQLWSDEAMNTLTLTTRVPTGSSSTSRLLSTIDLITPRNCSGCAFELAFGTTHSYN